MKDKTNLSEIEIEKHIQDLESPEPLKSLEELDQLTKPLPGYVGPGEWLKLLK